MDGETYLGWESTVYPDGGKCVAARVACRFTYRRMMPCRPFCPVVLPVAWPACERLRALDVAPPVSLALRRYEGLMKDGQCHGKGVFQYADGDRFEGEYFEGQMDGMGVYRWSNGRRGPARPCCRGNLAAADAAHRTLSAPRLPDPPCSIFKGQWKENNMHGCGKKWYPGGAVEEACAPPAKLQARWGLPRAGRPRGAAPAGRVDRGQFCGRLRCV